ncbi:hypothetical protein EX30DRAFT_349256 [Ascodesmis nigricans]|uniref:Uncharacterized protein n=1 Tax=Ascodesmis nigricans TaxID=341454 RepID=A0A4S2MW08_9PEZI|nr:hypothetical protein EX30DRAFT_349256 [Ascodesmis nigricans]
MALSAGIVEVQVDSTSGSKKSDNKRKYNYAACKRFHKWRKEDMLLQNQHMQVELMARRLELPPMSPLSPHMSQTPEIGSVIESIPSTAASTPGAQPQANYFGVLEPSVSPAPSVPAALLPRISPASTSHGRGMVRPDPAALLLTSSAK